MVCQLVENYMLFIYNTGILHKTIDKKGIQLYE